jgi:hypothetical protein
MHVLSGSNPVILPFKGLTGWWQINPAPSPTPSATLRVSYNLKLQVWQTQLLFQLLCFPRLRQYYITMFTIGIEIFSSAFPL